MFDHMKHDRRLRDDGEEARDRRQRRRGGFFLRAASSAGGTSARQRCARASPFEIRGAARILLGGLRSFLSRLSFHVRSFVGFVLVRSRPLPRTSRCKVAAARKGVSPAITTPSPRTETSSPRDTRDIMLLRSIFLLPAFVERRRLHSRDRDAVPWSSPADHTSWRLDQNNSTVLCGGKEKEREKRVVYNDLILSILSILTERRLSPNHRCESGEEVWDREWKERKKLAKRGGVKFLFFFYLCFGTTVIKDDETKRGAVVAGPWGCPRDMLPRDLGCRDYNVLRGETRLLAHGSSEDNGRSVSFHPRGVEYRVVPVVQVKPDYAVPYVLCWRVAGTTIHRIQVPLQHHHHHQQHHHHHHHHHHRQHHRYQRRHRQRRRRRHLQPTVTPRRHHPAPFLQPSDYPLPCASGSSQRANLATVPAMETRWASFRSYVIYRSACSLVVEIIILVCSPTPIFSPPRSLPSFVSFAFRD